MKLILDAANPICRNSRVRKQSTSLSLNVIWRNMGSVWKIFRIDKIAGDPSYVTEFFPMPSIRNLK